MADLFKKWKVPLQFQVAESLTEMEGSFVVPFRRTTPAGMFHHEIILGLKFYLIASSCHWHILMLTFSPEFNTGTHLSYFISGTEKIEF